MEKKKCTLQFYKQTDYGAQFKMDRGCLTGIETYALEDNKKEQTTLRYKHLQAEVNKYTKPTTSYWEEN